MRRILVVNFFAFFVACSADPPAVPRIQELQECSSMPTGVDSESFTIDFVVPPGLMPDPSLDGQPAQLAMRRFKPVYAGGRCPDVPTRAALFVHGRTTPGTAVFDVRDPDPNNPGGRGYSLLEEAAWGGVHAFAVDLLGYGGSSRFTLDDPCNASIPGWVFNAQTQQWTCSASDGVCDDLGLAPPHPGNQQALLMPNRPLAGYCAHSSNVRFARLDVWTRDLRQAVDHIIKTVKPKDDKISLIGYSLGGVHVARYLDPSNTAYGNVPSENIGKIDRAILLDTITTGSVDEVPLARPHPSFPLVVSGGGRGLWNFPPPQPGQISRASICGETAGLGVPEQLFAQQKALDPIGAAWGAAGVNRSPTFNSYGLTLGSVASFPVPVLVVHGRDDSLASGGFTWPTGCNIYNSVSGAEKMLLTVDCATHGLLIQSCSGARCGDASSTPYGQPAGPWRGPRTTIQAAVVEWITSHSVAGQSSGPVLVDMSGNASVHTALADKLAFDQTCPLEFM